MTRKESYLIEGMSCTQCERAIQQAVLSLPGIITAKANFQASTLGVEYNPAEITIDSIKETIGKLGYRIVDLEKEPTGDREAHDPVG